MLHVFRENMLWYDILMDAAFMVDVFTRQYSDDRQYRWGKDLFLRSWKELTAGPGGAGQ